ncbi:unnamed protein product [Caenorhabditis brenneri]
MPPTFPLLRLPIDERLAVLRQMGNIHLFVISLISKRAKNLVTSANRKAKTVVVSVERKIKFLCEMFQEPNFDVELSIWKLPSAPLKVKKPRYVTILENSPNDTLIKCTKKEYDAKDWLDHLCQIFHQKDYRLIFGRPGSCYDLDSIYENFKNPDQLSLPTTENYDYYNRVLKIIIPKSRISFDFRVFENERPPEDILIQNYDSFLCFENSQLLIWTCPLDDLLSTNSREICTNVLGFSENDINKFLKLWIHGSNPRLERLLIGNVIFDYDNVLRGIQNCVVSEDQEETFQLYTFPLDVVVKGAREIRRMDGTVAGVVIDNEQLSFNFFILHDSSLNILSKSLLSYSFGNMQPTFPLLRLPIDERLAVLRQMRTKQLFLLSAVSKRMKNLVTSVNPKAVGLAFPLLRLPINARLVVLQQMRSNQLFFLSLLSKRAKILARSANRRAQFVYVSIARNVHLICPMPQGPRLEMQLSLWKKPSAPPKIKKPKFVRIYKSMRNNKTIKWEQKEYKIKDWLEHLCQVFHRKFHDIIFWPHASRFDFDSVYRHFKNPSHLCLHGTGNTDYDNRVLKMIIPKREMSLDFGNHPNGQLPKNILVQNYDIFNCYGNNQVMNQSFLLNDLLCINSREIRINQPDFSLTDLNKFLKLWIRGSNPRLQRLQIRNLAFEDDVVLSGIHNFILREDQVKVFKSYIEPSYDVDVKGGIEIYRMNGTVARITGQGGIFNFFVWHV